MNYVDNFKNIIIIYLSCIAINGGPPFIGK